MYLSLEKQTALRQKLVINDFSDLFPQENRIISDHMNHDSQENPHMYLLVKIVIIGNSLISDVFRGSRKIFHPVLIIGLMVN